MKLGFNTLSAFFKYFVFLQPAIILIGCGTRVQVFNFSSDLKKLSDSSYVYSNDTIELRYDFSEEYGVFGFGIRNLTNMPIYIDWSKSSFIYNDVKNDYWRDSWKSISSTSTWNPLYIGTLSSGVKEERITFIPPKSTYARAQFQIFNGLNLKSPQYKVIRSVVPRNDNLKKKTKIQRIDFYQEENPMALRNYMTYSVSSDFESPRFIEHQFNLKSVIEMDARHYQHYQIDTTKAGRWYLRGPDGQPILVSKFRTPSSFYIHVNRARSIR